MLPKPSEIETLKFEIARLSAEIAIATEEHRIDDAIKLATERAELSDKITNVLIRLKAMTDD